MLNILFILLFFSLSAFAQDNSIELLNNAKLDSLVQNRNDKILVVNYWATWCIPCKEEIPELNEFYKEYNKKVDLVGISIDFPNEIESRILPFMEKNKVLYKVYVNNFDKDENLINYFDNKWNGALPATYVVSKEGKVLNFVEGKLTLNELKSMVDEEL